MRFFYLLLAGWVLVFAGVLIYAGVNAPAEIKPRPALHDRYVIVRRGADVQVFITDGKWHNVLAVGEVIEVTIISQETMTRQSFYSEQLPLEVAVKFRPDGRVEFGDVMFRFGPTFELLPTEGHLYAS